LLSAHSVSFGYVQAGRPRRTLGRVVGDISLDVPPGSFIGILGPNGSGKTTLLKLLGGLLTPTAGEVLLDLRPVGEWPRRQLAQRIAIVPQELHPAFDYPVLDMALMGRFPHLGAFAVEGPADIAIAREALAATGASRFEHRRFSTLSGGEKQRVIVAAALAQQADILLLDEPTASLPEAEVRLLLDALRRHAERGQTVVFVTHRLEEVFAVADNAILLRDGRVVDVVAPCSITHADLVELIIGRTVEQVERLRGQEGGPTILEVEGLRAGSVGPVDLTLSAGEIVGLAGLVGSGRSSLLKALFGVIPTDAGTVRLDGATVDVHTPRDAMRSGFAFVPESRADDAAFPELSLLENVSLAVVDDYWSGGRIRGRAERRDAERLLETYLIKAESVDDPLSSLSGGNQQKAVVARWLRRDPRVLLLDEPTQGVDVGARAEIYGLIHRAVEAGSAALVASSDAAELAAVCDRVIVLRRGRVAGEIKDTLTSDRIDRLAHADTGAQAA
jgi:ribose transport system ATP-binding protein